MRLIEVAPLRFHGEIRFKFFEASDIRDNNLKYAILSHRWEENEEITFQEASEEEPVWRYGHRRGWKKIKSFAEVAALYQCDWIWCDTCCIDKTSSAELSEAINSMYRWYKQSTICIAYLSDISTSRRANFTQSIWFTRAWTLQELIAPKFLVFFDSSWNASSENQYWSNKRDLAKQIAERTGIDEGILEGRKKLEMCSVAQKMSWAVNRVAKRTEDVAYSLLGIFDVNMPMLYGEGKRAFERLQEEIVKRTADQSIFAWCLEGASPYWRTPDDRNDRDLFASHPNDFANCGKLRQQHKRKAFTLNNVGLEIELSLRPHGRNSYLGYLAVESGGSSNQVGLSLTIDPDTGHYCRNGAFLSKSNEYIGPYIRETRQVTILRAVPTLPVLLRNGAPAPAPASVSHPLIGFNLACGHGNWTLVNRWDPQRHWDRGEWSSENGQYKFRIPQNISASVAMLIFKLANKYLLIQLAYDFDFNPCCNISKWNPESTFLDRFRLHYSWTELDKHFTWMRTDGETGTRMDVKWEEGSRHQHTIINEYHTLLRCWLAKATERQDFTASIPTEITRPATNIQIRFSNIGSQPPEDNNKEWTFEILGTENWNSAHASQVTIRNERPLSSEMEDTVMQEGILNQASTRQGP